jgi:hypothetical protein
VTVFRVLFGAAALWPVLFLLAAQRDPPRPPEPVADPIAETSQSLVALKGDRLPIYTPPPPSPEPIPPVVIVQAATEGDMKQARAEIRQHRHREKRDICRGKGRRYYHKGRYQYWRCRR